MPNDEDRMTNSVHPDKVVLFEAVLFLYALFAYDPFTGFQVRMD